MTGDDVDILVVEDDPNDAELVARVLRKNHLADKLLLLKDGAEAMDFLFAQGAYARRAGAGNPRVILLDLKLPKINGIEVLQRLKSSSRTRRIPVVILTSSREERDLDEAYNLGANSYVTKHIHFEEFARIVAELAKYWLVWNKPPSR